MVIGHAAIAVAAKARWPRLPFALLLVATFFADVLDALLFWFVHPADVALWSHALVVLAPAALILGGGYALARRDVRGGWIMGATLFSHWLLDLITGAKLTWLHGPVLGLHLYDAPLADFAIESVLVLAAWWYARRRATGLVANARIYAGLVVMQLVTNLYGWHKQVVREREGLPAEVVNTP